ncbi:MAG TPA: Uma2 family endonuclease [Chthonomonadaceae bacterium]|nr:Uma2 family endonuclease [Chthonomonadaceae bacterium]
MAVAKPTGMKRFRDEEDFYPSSDGKPMAETDTHRQLMMYCIDALTIYFADRPDVYVSGNNFIYFEEGNPKARVSPDCYVVFGVPKRQRNSYMVWKEGGKLPAVVFELTSRKTRKEDVSVKRPLYESVLRVPEYFLFDPTGDYLKPRLQGYRLVEGRYQPLLPAEGRLHSEQLGLDLVEEGENLRLYDPQRNESLLTPLELAQRAEAEAQARAAAEAENERLRAEIEALRRQAGR